MKQSVSLKVIHKKKHRQFILFQPRYYSVCNGNMLTFLTVKQFDLLARCAWRIISLSHTRRQKSNWFWMFVRPSQFFIARTKSIQLRMYPWLCSWRSLLRILMCNKRLYGRFLCVHTYSSYFNFDSSQYFLTRHVFFKLSQIRGLEDAATNSSSYAYDITIQAGVFRQRCYRSRISVRRFHDTTE
jgi:hypothetical protein